MLYLETKFDLETAQMINDCGFSRIPIAYSKGYPVVVGVLLVKTVLGVDFTDETIGQLYMQGKINLKVPVYFT